VSFEDQPYRLDREGPDVPPDDVCLTVSYSPVPDETGVGGILITLTETPQRVPAAGVEAERDRLAREVEVERARLADVFRHAPSYLAVLRGPQYIFEWVNEAYYQLVGHRDLLGKPAFEALPDARGQGFEALLDQVMATGVPFVGREIPVVLTPTPGGPPKKAFLDFTYQPLVEADGTISGIAAHGSDVSEQVLARHQVERLLAESEHARRALESANAQLESQQRELEHANEQLQNAAVELESQAEELQATAAQLEERTEEAVRTAAAIAENERQFHLLADAIPTLAWTARADGYIDWYNSRWYEYTGTTPEQMAGWGWQSVHDPAVLPSVLTRWQQSIATGRPFEMTFPLRRADGQFRQFLTRVSPITDTAGRVVRWFGSNTDVHAERAARAAAERANQAKTDFLATMSHELRTPLNAIAGYAELLELGIHGPVTDQQHEAISRIQRSQRHLLGLINDVLNFAKLEAGHVEYRLEAVSVRQTIDAIEPLVALQLRTKTLRFERDACADGRVVRADREKLQQILTNLLSNAIKFTPAGGTIRLRCRDTGDKISIAVEDTGIGIAADRLDDVFEPFVQIDRRLNSPHEGTGLGLAISRDLARGMGGDLTVESTPGSGSTFTVTLPAFVDS
jgi:PAS domain S-box-containing protein